MTIIEVVITRRSPGNPGDRMDKAPPIAKNTGHHDVAGGGAWGLAWMITPDMV